MAGTYSNEQRLNDTIDRLGEKMGRLYHFLYNDTLSTQMKWQEYKELYFHLEKKKKRTEILSESAPFFFSMINRMHWHDVIISIARITDNAKTGSGENATLPMLREILFDRILSLEDQEEIFSELEFLKKMVDTMDKITLKCQPLRRLRNKVIAHADLEVAFAILDQDYKSKKIPKVTFDQVEGAVNELWTMIDLFEDYYFKRGTHHYVYLEAGSSALGLLCTLSEGLEMQKLRREAHEKGDYGFSRGGCKDI